MFACFPRSGSALGLAAAIGFCGAGVSHAEPLVFRSGYTVSYLGMTIARSDFTTKFEGDRFSVKGSLSSSALAGLFDPVKGGMRVSGRFEGGRARPDNYMLVYKMADKKRKTVIRFDADGGAQAENKPAPKKRKNWVALGAHDLENVADPLSATLLRAKNAGEVCGRTVRLFDGELRADIALSPDGTEDWNGTAAAVCKARFLPVSGYRRDRDAIAWLRDKSEIRLVFAPLGATGLYAPVRASIGTELGTVHITAVTAVATN